MQAIRQTAIVAAAILSGASAIDAAGILDGVRSEVNEPSQGSDGDGGNSSGGNSSGGNSSGGGWTASCDDEDDAHPFADLTAWVTVGVVTSPWTLPIIILDDDYTQTPIFPSAPYSSNPDGYLAFPETPDRPEPARSWAGRLSIDTGGNFDDFATIGGRLQLDHQNRFGIDAAWAHLHERVPGGWDDMTLGDANLVYRFAQGSSAQFYTGVGFNWLSDHGDFDAGFNVTYGADWFPVRPLVVSTSLDIGGLGRASLFRSRTTVGAMIDRFEIYTGFDYLNIEGVDIPTGLAGLRFWY